MGSSRPGGTVTKNCRMSSTNSESLIGDAWNLREVEERYADFLTTFGELRAATPVEAFQAQVRLVHAWRRFPFLDPGLPRELLDHDWPGPGAAALFHRRHDEWHGNAQRYWTELEAQSSLRPGGAPR